MLCAWLLLQLCRSYELISGSTMTWWRHHMETYSALRALCEEKSSITDEFPSKRPVTWHFDVFCYLRLNKRLSKPSRCRWSGTPSCSLWRPLNDTGMINSSRRGHVLLFHLWFTYWLGANFANRCYVNQCYLNVNSISVNELLWNLYDTTKFI